MLALVQLGLVSLRAHQELDLFIAEIARQIEESPQSAKLYLKRGELHGEHGDWAASLADFDRAETLDDALLGVRLARSEVYLKMGEPAKALLEACPESVRGLLVCARAQSALRELDLADHAYEAAIRLSDSPQPDLYLEWHVMHLEAEPVEQVETALMILDLGMKRLGPLATLQLAAIQCERRRGEIDAALGRVADHEVHGGNRLACLKLRGDILVEGKRPKDAKRTYMRALQAIEELPPRRRKLRPWQRMRAEITAQMVQLTD